jgi:hypothetical protein
MSEGWERWIWQSRPRGESISLRVASVEVQRQCSDPCVLRLGRWLAPLFLMLSARTSHVVALSNRDACVSGALVILRSSLSGLAVFQARPRVATQGEGRATSARGALRPSRPSPSGSLVSYLPST